MGWKLATEPPKKSGVYLVIGRYSSGSYHDEVVPMKYSVNYDGWNCLDKEGGDLWRLSDIRTSGADDYCSVVAWYEVETPTKELLDQLMAGVK